MIDATTPLMQQYQSIKSRYPHALLLFRLGDFYELFYEDAILAARELQITLTSRNREKGQPIPMCGVPYHAADGYIARLIRNGFKIAICDQMEAPGPGKKLVRREVVRVITPGPASDSTMTRKHSLLPAPSCTISAKTQRKPPTLPRKPPSASLIVSATTSSTTRSSSILSPSAILNLSRQFSPKSPARMLPPSSL